MQAIKHKITHQYQPTSTSCGYASLAMMLSHHGVDTSAEKILNEVPIAKDESGEPIGSLTAQLADWCVQQGYAVDFTSFDFLITDFSWIGMDNQELLDKLESVKEVRDVQNVGGKYWSKMYVQAYIDLINSGGNLSVKPHVTTVLLYTMLEKAPVYTNICSSIVHAKGRQQYPEPQTSKLLSVDEDVNGTIGTHSIVIYGHDEKGNFMIADPWDGLYDVDPETMLCAITAAELECDSQCFQIHRK